MTSARRLLPRWLLVLLLVGMPLLELFVLIRVGQVIGAAWTIVLLIVASFVGGWLIRNEGAKVWRSLAESLREGRMPTRELADGALVVLAGALMLSPGFVTDVFALLLILPGTRQLARRALTAYVASRVVVTSGGVGFGFAGTPTSTPGDARRPGPPTGGQVIRGEVVDP
ncbi:FxsA family protein [Nocardioides jishulii]|uniref:FxsA family protein n=1 Tax=Nocardioides jishulii TaxID=2575440 RepID=A0A4U2YQZ0_9ACTN|nr:FxsA family protein [Nocardioides jishulii]QCX27564.1 FxsA family protein [Nocardioides jishulii]TKI62371.1 FxsA family protein [Nocardioides jishulii]